MKLIDKVDELNHLYFSLYCLYWTDQELLNTLFPPVSTPTYLQEIKLHDTNRVSAQPHEADAVLHPKLSLSLSVYAQIGTRKV